MSGIERRFGLHIFGQTNTVRVGRNLCHVRFHRRALFKAGALGDASHGVIFRDIRDKTGDIFSPSLLKVIPAVIVEIFGIHRDWLYGWGRGKNFFILSILSVGGFSLRRRRPGR